MIIPTTRQHGITDDEIRATISDYAFRFPIVARKPGAELFVYVGPAADTNTAYIEVFADERLAETVHAFHAMMLRPSTVHAAGLQEYIPASRIARRQRR